MSPSLEIDFHLAIVVFCDRCCEARVGLVRFALRRLQGWFDSLCGGFDSRGALIRSASKRPHPARKPACGTRAHVNRLPETFLSSLFYHSGLHTHTFLTVPHAGLHGRGRRAGRAHRRGVSGEHCRIEWRRGTPLLMTFNPLLIT